MEDLIIANFGVEYVADQLTLAAEYRLQYGDINGQVDASAVGGGTIPFTQLARSDGGYVQAAYRLDDRWEIGSYYGVYYGNRNDREGDNLAAIGQERWLRWQKDLALTIRCDINEYWVVKVEGHYLDGVAMLAPSENPNGYEQHWFMFAAKTTVSF